MPQPQNASYYPEHAPPADGVFDDSFARHDGVSHDGAPQDGARDGSAAQPNGDSRGRALRILLLECDADAARLMSKYLGEAPSFCFEVEAVATVQEALSALGRHDYDACLLGLPLRDVSGMDAFATLSHEAPDLPFVLMSEQEDDALALHSVQYGAQDHLIKSEVNGRTLPRTMLYAVERQRIRSQLRALSMQDALTGLYNRRGFFSMAEQNLKAARREKRAMALFYADLDGLKEINDNFGHHEGDWALIKAADILRATFRDSDIIARLSGDEFTALAWVQSAQDIERVKARLSQHIAEVNALARRRFSLLISIGSAFVAPGEAISVNELLTRADSALYLAKKTKPASVLRPASHIAPTS